MKTLHEVVKHELLKQFPPQKGLKEAQLRAYFRKLDRASSAIIRAIRHYVDFNGEEGNGHG